jgi:FkbM family methyltransferase
MHAVTGRDPTIIVNVPNDLHPSPFATTLLTERAERLRLQLRSSRVPLLLHMEVVSQVCNDYFRTADCVPRPGELVIDAGANVGCYSLIAALLEPKAQLTAFEPLDDAYAKLIGNIELNGMANRIVPNRLALGSRSGELVLTRIFEGTQGTPVPDLLSPGVIWGQSGREAVPVVTLDQYLSTHQLRLPDIIKLDVEGFELEVLEGAPDALSNARLLIAEWHSAALRQAMQRLTTQAGLEFLPHCSDDFSGPLGIAYFCRPRRS